MNHAHSADAVLRQVRELIQAEGLLAGITQTDEFRRPGIALHLPPDADPEGGFSHDEEFRVVRWRGDAFHFSAMQRAVVRRLFDAAVSGHPEVGQSALLKAADSESPALRDLFRGHRAWGVLIVRVEPAVYRLACADELRRAAA